MAEISRNWLKTLIPAVILLGIASAAVIPDPEFDVIPHNWILTSAPRLMMKTLPKGSNYTFKEYYASWGMKYDTELAMKDIANASVVFVDRRIRETANMPENFLVDLDLYISECKNEKEIGTTKFLQETRKITETLVPVFNWKIEYCPTRKVVQWCDSGERLETNMAGKSTIQHFRVSFSANVTARCPTSFVRDFLHVFREKDEETWHFRWPFYAMLVFFGVMALIAIGFLIKKLVPKRAEPPETGFWVHRVAKKTSHSSGSHSKSYSSENEVEFAPRRK